MAPEFVTFTSYYTQLPVGVRVDRVVVVTQVANSTRLEMDGLEDDVAVSEPFTVVVARLNGEDLTDGR